MKMENQQYWYYVGIDPGVKTGLALNGAKEGRYLEIVTVPIHLGLKLVLSWYLQYDTEDNENGGLLVRLEDARQVRFKTQAHRQQGAGSVKRDVGIWIEFMNDYGIRYELSRPNKDVTKWPEDRFKRLTGYTKRTSQHGRDAAMLVYGYSTAKPQKRQE